MVDEDVWLIIVMFILLYMLQLLWYVEFSGVKNVLESLSCWLSHLVTIDSLLCNSRAN